MIRRWNLTLILSSLFDLTKPESYHRLLYYIITGTTMITKHVENKGWGGPQSRIIFVMPHMHVRVVYLAGIAPSRLLNH